MVLILEYLIKKNNAIIGLESWDNVQTERLIFIKRLASPAWVMSCLIAWVMSCLIFLAMWLAKMQVSGSGSGGFAQVHKAQRQLRRSTSLLK